MISKTRGTHYSLGQAPADMWKAAGSIGEKLIQYSEYTNQIPVLAYTGMSGIATATAVSLWLQTKHPKFVFYMIYVRKEHEKSHGQDVEHNFLYTEHDERAKADKLNFFIAFVDDMVSSGETRKRVQDRITAFSDETGYYLFQRLKGVQTHTYCTQDQ